MAKRRGPAGRDIATRCAEQIQIDASGCWYYNGKRVRGWIKVAGRNRRSYRVVYELMRGPVPEGHILHHLCGDEGCVNPDHLEPMTPHDHLSHHAALRPSPTHCAQGHEMTEANTVLVPRPDGHTQRLCHRCKRNRENALAARKRRSRALIQGDRP